MKRYLAVLAVIVSLSPCWFSTGALASESWDYPVYTRQYEPMSSTDRAKIDIEQAKIESEETIEQARIESEEAMERAKIESEERQAWIFAGGIAIAGIAIGIGVLNRKKK